MTVKKIRPSTHLIKRAFSPSHNLSFENEEKPIFIIGSGRSGNTLLRRILMNDPRIYIPPETYVLGQIIRDFDKYSRLEWSTLLHLVLNHLSLSEDFKYFPTPYLRPLYQNLLKAKENERCLSTILSEFYLYMAAIVKPNANRWGDKTPLNTASLDKIDKVFPKAQYIHLVRNVHDVCLSYVNMGRYKTYQEAANRWKTANQKIEKFKKYSGERVKTITYENLVQSPEIQVRAICEFLGQKYDPLFVTDNPTAKVLGDVNVGHYNNVQKNISDKSIGNGVKAIEKDIKAEIFAIAGALMKHYGYGEN